MQGNTDQEARAATLAQAAEQFRLAQPKIFANEAVQLTTYWDLGPVVGVGLARDGLAAGQRIVLLEAACDPEGALLDFDLVGSPPSPRELVFLLRVLKALLPFLHEKTIVRHDEQSFLHKAGRLRRGALDDHWRREALSLSLSAGDLAVLRSPVLSSPGQGLVQVVQTHRDTPNANLTGLDLRSGRPIAGLTLFRGRAARLSPTSSQHVDLSVHSQAELDRFLAMQRKREDQSNDPRPFE